MGDPAEDLQRMRQVEELLEMARVETSQITPRAGTMHGHPNPNEKSPTEIQIMLALEHARQEIEILEQEEVEQPSSEASET